MSSRLRRSGLLAGAIGGGAALAALGAGVALAQAGEEPLTVNPTGGPLGQSFSVSGDNCDGTQAQVVVTHNDDTIAVLYSEGVLFPPLGSWSVQVTITEPGLEGQTLGVSATCILGNTTYAPAQYTVDAPTTTTSSTTSTTSTTTPTTGPTTSTTAGTPGTTPPGGGDGATTTTTAAPGTPAGGNGGGVTQSAPSVVTPPNQTG
jgi:hypothetical protein